MFLTLGLWLSGGFVISSTLIVLLLFTNDFMTMSIATDRVQPAPEPQRWQVRRLMGAAAVLATVSLAFTLSAYGWLRSTQEFDAAQLQTAVFLLLAFANQAGVYVLRTDGPLWSFAPGRWMAWVSVGDVAAVSLFATMGWLMAPLPTTTVALLIGAAAVFALVLDQVKRFVFPRFAIV